MAVKTKEGAALLQLLRTRFEKNMQWHPDVAWVDVLSRLYGNRDALNALRQMEVSGGEPDVIGQADGSGRFTFYDCSAESPAGRRSICFDGEARKSRKEHAPESSAVEMCAAMGIELLTEEQYRSLQKMGEFDRKTSSWISTPPELRRLGGALFCDRRYDRVFVYHSGVQSYYAGRGFRGSLRV